MTTERMLELLLLFKTKEYVSVNGKPIDRDKHCRRYLELMREFLNPYVIDNAEKSEQTLYS